MCSSTRASATSHRLSGPVVRAVGRVFALCVIGVVMVMSPPASAAPGEVSQAAAAYEKGKGELRGGKLAEALSTFREGLDAPETDQLETWQLLLGAALAAEKLGTGADSIEYYRRFLDASEAVEKFLTPKWRERRRVVGEAVDELQRKLNETHGYLTVSSTPVGAALFVNGERAGVDRAAKTPFGLYLTPGSYQIRVERTGFTPEETSVVIEANKLKPLAMTLSEIVVEAPAPPPSAPVAPAPVAPIAPPVEAGGTGTMGMVGMILLGAGGVSLIGGVVGSVMGKTKQDAAEELVGPICTKDPNSDDCIEWVKDTNNWDKAKDDRRNELDAQITEFGLVAGIMYGIGAAAAVTGLVLVLIDDGGDDATEPAASFQVTPTPGGAFGQATWRF